MNQKREHIISKFMDEEINIDEQNQLNHWLKNEEYQKEFKKAIVANHIVDLGTQKYDSDKAFGKFKEIIESKQVKKKEKFVFLKKYYKYAAIALIAVMIGSYFIVEKRIFNSDFVSIVISNSTQKKFELPDGTKVMMNASSKLSYNKNFLDDRIISLDGEAFFEVPKLQGKSFVVILNEETRIKVLGTKFGVKAYSDDAKIVTALFEGKVEISSNTFPNNKITLKPNTTAIIDKNNNASQLLIGQEYMKNSISWKNSEFIFYNDYLGDIMNELSRFYDVEIIVNSSELKYQSFTASFNKDVKLEKVLADLSLSGNFKIEKTDNSHFKVFN